MKTRSNWIGGLAVGSLAMATGYTAEMKDMPGMADKPAAAKPQGKQFMGTGVVKSVDAQKGVVTIAHEPIKELNWPSMTMGFKVSDSALLKKAAAGKKIDFVLEDRGGPTIVSIK